MIFTLKWLLAGAIVLLTACNQVRSPLTPYATEEESRRTLLAQIEAAAGPESSSCGLTPLGVDLSRAASCAVTAFSERRAFWTASEIQGEDSQLWMAVVLKADGTFRSYIFDSNTSGGGGLLKGRQYGVYGGTASCSRLSLPTAQQRYIDCE
jgi:hypothetical protein